MLKTVDMPFGENTGWVDGPPYAGKLEMLNNIPRQNKKQPLYVDFPNRCARHWETQMWGGSTLQRDATIERLSVNYARTADATQAGFIYVLVNRQYPGWAKVGETADYEDRLKTYKSASPLDDFKMLLAIPVSDRRRAAGFLLEYFKTTNKVRGEWIKIDSAELVKFLKTDEVSAIIGTIGGEHDRS